MNSCFMQGKNSVLLMQLLKEATKRLEEAELTLLSADDFRPSLFSENSSREELVILLLESAIMKFKVNLLY